jgi:hypothetical protein
MQVSLLLLPAPRFEPLSIFDADTLGGVHTTRERAPNHAASCATERKAGRDRNLFLTLNPAFRSVFARLAAAVNAAACHVTRKTISEGPEHVTGEERIGASAVVAARLPLQPNVTRAIPTMLGPPSMYTAHRCPPPPPPSMYTAQHLQPVAPGVALGGTAVPEQPAWDKADVSCTRRGQDRWRLQAISRVIHCRKRAGSVTKAASCASTAIAIT